MTEFQAMLDTVEDLVSTLEEEFPLHGTLLRVQLEDEVPADDGTEMCIRDRSTAFWWRGTGGG